jgi:hypothetical protein
MVDDPRASGSQADPVDGIRPALTARGSGCPGLGADEQARHPSSEATDRTKHPAPPLFEAGPVEE